MSGNRLKVYLFLLAILLNVIYLLPVLDSPYLGDDSWSESSVKGLVLLSDTNLLDVCWNAEKEFLKSGRWYPLAVYYHLMFYYLDQHLYKATVIFLIVVNILAFGYLVKVITSSDSAALTAIVLSPLFLQIRQYHDAILSYYCLMQVEFLFLVLSLICFARYLRESRTIFLLMSLLSYTVCLLTYEASYTFWILHALLAYLHFGRRSLRRIIGVTSPFLIAASINLGISLLVRAWSGMVYEGVSVNLSPTAWLQAFLKQVFAAVPLSYFFARGVEHSLEYARTYFMQDLIGICAFWAVLWGLVWHFAFGEDKPQTTDSPDPLIWIGLGLWIVPAIMVSFSVKYQNELRWGLAYLPVYLSSFGVIMIVVYASQRLYFAAVRLPGPGTMVALTVTTLLGVITCGITYNTNRAIIEKFNLTENYPRQVIENALRGRLMQNVPEGSVVLCSLPIRGWDSPAFYSMHSGSTVQVVRTAGFPHETQIGNSRVENAFACWEVAGASHCYDFRNSHAAAGCMQAQLEGVRWPALYRSISAAGAARQAFFLKYDALARGVGYAVSGRMVDLKADNHHISCVSADSVRVYVAFPFDYQKGSTMIAGNWIDRETYRTSGCFNFQENDLLPISEDPHGRLYELPQPPGGKLFEPASILATIAPRNR